MTRTSVGPNWTGDDRHPCQHTSHPQSYLYGPVPNLPPAILLSTLPRGTQSLYPNLQKSPLSALSVSPCIYALVPAYTLQNWIYETPFFFEDQDWGPRDRTASAELALQTANPGSTMVPHVCLPGMSPKHHWMWPSNNNNNKKRSQQMSLGHKTTGTLTWPLTPSLPPPSAFPITVLLCPPHPPLEPKPGAQGTVRKSQQCIDNDYLRNPS